MTVVGTSKQCLPPKGRAADAAAKSLQSCPTLCDPTDGSPPGSAVPGILQARTWEWVACPSPVHESEKWKWSRSVVSDSSRPHGLQPTRLLHPWDFPGKSPGVGCHCLLWKDGRLGLIPNAAGVTTSFLFVEECYLIEWLDHVLFTIHPLMDIWAASAFWLVWIMLLCTFLYKFFVDISFQFSWIDT